MAATKTNLYMNWTGVVVTPTPYDGTSATAISVGGVVDVQIDGKSVQESFYGDARKFARLIRNTAKTRMIKIVGGEIEKLTSIPEDTPCTVVAVLNDAINGTGVGAITFTMTLGLRQDLPIGGQNNKFARGEVTFNAHGASNDTDPLTLAVA